MGDHIFISYSRKDRAIVDRIVALLQHSNIAVWLDKRIHVGTADWDRSIRQAITTSRGVIYAASEDAAKSDYVGDELRIARDNKIPIYPLWIAGATWMDCIPMGFGKIQFADGRINLDVGVQDILAQVRNTFATARTALPEQSPNDDIFSISLEEPKRRLPLYLLLDCSETMKGTPMDALTKGLTALRDGLIRNLSSVQSDTIWVSVISFGDTAIQYPLCPIHQFQPAPLKVGGKRALGAALRLLADSIVHDLMRPQREQLGDYHPIAFILTDGEPSDYIEAQVTRLKSLPGNLLPSIAVLVSGSTLDIEIFRWITNNVFTMQDASADTLAGLIQWRD